jgi:putative DNA primase/helicase
MKPAPSLATETIGTRASAEAIRVKVSNDALAVYGAILGGNCLFVKKGAQEWAIPCPLHQDNNPSLRVNPQKGLWRCDPCNVGGDVFRLYAELNGLSCRSDFPRIVEGLSITLGVSSAVPSIVLSGGALERQKDRSNGVAPAKILTREEFAKAKGFESEFLELHGVVEEKGALVFHYLLINGQRAERQRIRLALVGDKRFIWNRSNGHPVPYGAWLLKDWIARSVTSLLLVEGESDSLTAWLHGIAALGIPGADMCSILQASHIAGFRKIFICREDDHGGETFEKGCIGQLAKLEFAGSVEVIEIGRAAAKDLNELHLKFLDDPGAFKSEWDALKLQARRVELPLTGIEVFGADAIVEKSVHWHWENRLPEGKLVLFVGPPGLGKSFATLDIVSRMSNGATWPDGAPNGVVADSIIFSAEDGMEDTIVPRLVAQRADRSRILIAKRVREVNDSGEVARRGFNLARDLPKLEKILDQRPATKLVVVDPVSAYMARVDSHKNSEVRSDVLDPLAELAERRAVTVLAVTHLNKSAGSNALERVSGSIAFPAAARVVWGFARDPDDPGKGLFLFGKSNVGPEVSGLAYRIAEDENRRATLQWIAGNVDENLTQILRREQDQQKGGGDKISQACELIRQICAFGSAKSDDIDSRARELGISNYAIREAKKLLGCKSRRSGGFAGQGQWFISLPQGGGSDAP